MTSYRWATDAPEYACPSVKCYADILVDTTANPPDFDPEETVAMLDDIKEHPPAGRQTGGRCILVRTDVHAWFCRKCHGTYNQEQVLSVLP